MLNYIKLSDQLKLRFKRTINWNKNQSKVTIQQQSQYLHYLIDSTFQRVNRPFVLSFENNAQQTRNNLYFLPSVEIYVVECSRNVNFEETDTESSTGKNNRC